VAKLWAPVALRGVNRLGSNAKVVGRPLINNRHVSVGDDFMLWSVHRKTHLGGTGTIDIGDNVFLNSGVVILAFDRIEIEDDVAMATEVFVTDSDNHPLADRPMRQAPVTIGRGAWLATRTTVLAGVRIGRRAVVAAGSVVTSDVPDDTLVAGVPARPVRTLSFRPGQVSAWKDEVQRCG
jgi:acetyltransferase-like isoleucine patch superfamily enzyme